MPYDWNPEKCSVNITKHGIDFVAVHEFEWETAMVEADTRQHYGEVRLKALGVIKVRLHSLIYTIRRTTWIISLRKASQTEARRYASQD